MKKLIEVRIDDQAGAGHNSPDRMVALRASRQPAAQAKPVNPEEAGEPRHWRSPEDILRACERFGHRRRFNRVILRAWFQVTPARSQKSTVTNYPQAWLDEYRDRKLHALDPILRHATQTGAPFGWNEALPQTPGERRFLLRMEFFGLKHGITVPLHGAGGELFALSFSGRELPDNQDERWSLFADTYRFLSEALPDLRRVLVRTPVNPSPKPLTRAQKEVFVYLMRGKTLKDIARCLNLHIRAVEDRVARACQSLEASSRAQALARALSSGQIRLFDEDEDSEELWHAREQVRASDQVQSPSRL